MASRPEVDRQFLFAILAFQNGFLSREQLLNATNLWLEDKAQPMNRLLVERQMLQEDEHALLLALVDKHLELHGNDPQRSLAAVSSLGSVKEELCSLGDADVEASIGHASQDCERDPHATVEHPVGKRAFPELRFRILRPHARGGLGQVYVARDEELQREVALKEIQSNYANNPDSRQRFVLEAEITGGLEHPGIVPVYGFGQYADGRPFYAMRFIRGDSLEEAIDRFHQKDKAAGTDTGWQTASESSLALRGLLGRFVDVCNAMDYAHNRGVLHRDLKPGNIMLGKYGETLVVDWGLAKTADPTEEYVHGDETKLQPQSGSQVSATLMGAVIGTPAYMSPEQAEGRLDALGPATDVYSLGATLYHLMTGQPPFQKHEKMLTKVQKGEFKRPRELRPDLAKPLEAICLKAMARQPNARYASARQLADEVEMWLADEPVGAWQEPFAIRARRWMRRHQTLVGSLATAIVVVVLMLSISLALLTAAYASEERQRQRAEQNFELAREAVDESFTVLSEDKLLAQPGMKRLRIELLNQALELYEKLVSQPDADDSLIEEQARDYARIGRIKEQLGLPDQAVGNYEQAERLLKSLPANSNRLQELGTTSNSKGRAWHSAGDLDRAEQAWNIAVELREERASSNASDIEANRLWANSMMNLGVCAMEKGDDQAARSRYTEAQRIRGKFAESDHRKLLRDLGQGYYDLANLDARRAQQAEDSDEMKEDAIQNLHAAIERFAGLVTEPLAHDSDLADVQNQLALCHILLARLTRDGDLNHVQEQLESARTIAEELAWEYVSVPDYRNTLATSLTDLAGVRIAIARAASTDEERARVWRQAQRDYAEAAFILNPLAEIHRKREYRIHLATTYLHWGIMQLTEGNVDKGRETLGMSLSIWEAMMADDENDAAAKTNRDSIRKMLAEAND